MRATSTRFDETTLARLDALAKTMGKSRSEALTEAVERYLEYHEWFLTKVDEGLADVDQGRTVSHAAVKDVLAGYGVKTD